LDVEATKLKGALIIQPKVFGDERGFLVEMWNQDRYSEFGVSKVFVQDNISASSRDVLRGLHFQNPNQQGKLVTVLEGEVYDVAVDIRVGSPTFGEWVGVELSGVTKKQFYIPTGFAHGFCVTSETALFGYKCTDSYNPKAEMTVLWNDPDLGIQWPSDHPNLSKKDEEGIPLAKIPEASLPKYQG